MRPFLVSIAVILLSQVSSYGENRATKTGPKDSTIVAGQTLELIEAQQSRMFQDSLHAMALKMQIENTVQSSKRRALELELHKIKINDSLQRAEVGLKIERDKSLAKGYSVLLGSDTICTLYTTYASFSAQERAESTSKKLKQVSSLYIPGTDSLTIKGDRQTTDIIFGDIIILSLNLSDAMWNNLSQEELAQQYKEKMQQSIQVYKKQTSMITIIEQIGLSLLVIGLCCGIIMGLRFLFNQRLIRFIESKRGAWFKGFSIRNYQVLNEDNLIKFVIFAFRVLYYVLILLVLYIALPLLFSIFPLTRRLADKLFDWILTPVKMILNGVIDYIPNLLIIIVIWVAFHYLLKGVKYMMHEIEVGRLILPGFYADWAKATYNIVRVLILAFAFVMIFPYLPGSDSDVFKGVSVFLGIVFSLGSSSVVANIMAGMVITYMRPFRVGDHIKIGDQTGDVLEKTPFVTRIKTHKREVVTIPNSNILSSVVINYSTSSTEQGVIFHTTITIGYDVPWRLVQSMMIQAAQRTEYVIQEPAPFVLQTSLDDFYVSYQLCVFTKNPEKQASINSALNSNIQDLFGENGVEIMSPHYRAGRDGENSTIPAFYAANSSKPLNEENKTEK